MPQLEIGVLVPVPAEVPQSLLLAPNWGWALNSGAASMQPTAAGTSTEAVDSPRHGLLLRFLMGFVKAVQDSRQREANRHLARYYRLTRDTSQRPKHPTA